MSAFLRRVQNFFVHRPPLGTLVRRTYKSGMQFLDLDSYQRYLAHYLAKNQTFEEYSANPENEKKKYIDLNFAAYFQCYNNRRATFETLRSFRKFYPHTPVYLVSDHGEDFRDIAVHFNCDYVYAPERLDYWPTVDMVAWFARLADACKRYPTADWMLILEEDVRTRDRISKFPEAHLAGQGGGDRKTPAKQLPPAAQKYLLKKYPDMEMGLVSGCGGSIFHRRSFLNCFANANEFKTATKSLGIPSLSGASDIAITFFFLMNGFIVRRWLDFSQDSTGYWGPAAAFDHKFKKYYGLLLTKEMLRTHE